MIHNSSSDPVLIKKISLKVWSLRDEIEARIQVKLEAGEIVPEEMEAILNDLRGEYSKKTPVPNNVLQLKSGTDLSNDEDEMAKAMAGETNEDATANEEATPEGAEAKKEEVLPTGDKKQTENLVMISAEPPPLPAEKIFNGKTVLAEIEMDKMLFFSNKPFTEGQSIVIQFCIPKTFLINADVVYCRTFNIKSRIISQNNYNYRMLVKFTFLKEGERALLRQFLQSIEPDLSKIEKKTSSNKESSDDGFGDLNDLGL